MKRSLLPIFSCWLIFTSVVSGQTKKSFVTGKVTESTTGLPLELLNIVLVNSSGSNAVIGTVTDKNGVFKLDSIAEGTYFLRMSLVGYETLESPSFRLLQNKGIDFGIISMNISEIHLKVVDVTAVKTPIVSTIDRKVYYPEKDLMAQSGSIGDVLENIPSVSVDVDGNVSLRGSEKIMFLLNGKPSGLLTVNTENVLQQIPASLIERIEVITNPSAKFKPDGAAGIINIVLKKDFKPGLNGTTAINAGTNDRYNGAVSMNYSPGKLNIFGMYGMRQNYDFRKLTDSRIVRDDSLGTTKSYFYLHEDALGKPFSQNANAVAEYSLNTKNKIGLSGNYFNFHQKRIHDISTLEKDTLLSITSHYYTDRTEIEDDYEWEIQAHFEHQFRKKEHVLQLESSYSEFDELEDIQYSDAYAVPEMSPLTGHNTIHNSGNITTFDCEYVNPINEEFELEAGYEGEFSRGQLDYSAEYFNESQLQWIQETDKSNQYKYQQDIHAIFGTLSVDIEDFNILAGIRAEQVYITSNLLLTDSVIHNNYFKLFPSVHLSIEISDNKKIGLSYSKRVNRPDPDELNPFPEYSDPRNIESGNSDLQPEQVHSIELAYEIKKNAISFNPGLYYRYTYDAFAEITRYVNDSVLLTTMDNLTNEQAAGLELVFSWNYKKLLTMTLNSNLYFNTINGENIDYAESNSTVSWDIRLAGIYNLTAKTKLQMNATYRSPMLTAQGKSLSLYYANAGVRQDIFKNRASISLTVSDVFNTMKWEYEIDTDELYQKVTRKRHSQIVYLGFTWRFGLSKTKSPEEMQFEDKM